MFLSVVKRDKFIIQLLEQNKTPPIINNSIYAPKVSPRICEALGGKNRDETIVVRL